MSLSQGLTGGGFLLIIISIVVSDFEAPQPPAALEPSVALTPVAPGPRHRNPAAVYLASLAPAGRRAVQSRLDQVAELLTGRRDWRTCPWAQLRYPHVAALRALLAAAPYAYAPATINLTLCALRGVARAAFNLELISAEDYQRLRDVRAVRGQRLPAGRHVAAGELAALMQACAADASPAGVRDAALIALLYAAGGMRRAEVVALNREDFNEQTGELVVRGKGRKERLVYVDNGALDALLDWLVVRGDAPGPLFVPIHKGGELQWRRLSGQAVYNLLRKRAAEGVVKAVSPHDLRRTFVSDLLEAGADISTVAQLAGHASVQTTARYDRRGEAAKQKATGLLHVPWRRRLLPSDGSGPPEGGSPATSGIQQNGR